MGSPFASQCQSDPIPLPFDPPHTITVRKLTGRECDTAREAHAAGVAAGGSRLWATKFRRILEHSISDKAQIEQAIADPLTGFDRYALVKAGLVAWSYPRPVKPVAAQGTNPVVMVDAVEDLDDEAVDFIATEILRLTKPALFHATEEDAETAQKETDPAPSIT